MTTQNFISQVPQG